MFADIFIHVSIYCVARGLAASFLYKCTASRAISLRQHGLLVSFCCSQTETNGGQNVTPPSDVHEAVSSRTRRDRRQKSGDQVENEAVKTPPQQVPRGKDSANLQVTRGGEW